MLIKINGVRKKIRINILLRYILQVNVSIKLYKNYFFVAKVSDHYHQIFEYALGDPKQKCNVIGVVLKKHEVKFFLIV